MIARKITTKPTDGIHQIVITKSQFKDPRLDYVTGNVNSDVVNYGRCVNRVPKCDVTNILFLEYFNFGSGFQESILNQLKVANFSFI